MCNEVRRITHTRNLIIFLIEGTTDILVVNLILNYKVLIVKFKVLKVFEQIIIIYISKKY